MKLLYFAYIEPKYKQLYFKVAGQVNALKAIGVDVECFVIGKGASQLTGSFPFTIIDINQYNLTRDQIVENLISKYNPKYVYFRYPNGYKNVLQALIPIAEKHNNFFFEHNTREEDELKAANQIEVLNQEIEFGRVLITKAAGLIGMTNSFSEHQKQRVPGLKVPVTTIANGITVADFPLAESPKLNNKLTLLFVGYIALHHGLERILEGISAYKGSIKVELLIAGKFFNKEYENKILKLINDLKLQGNVKFLGELINDDLNVYYNQSHICIGSLGMYLIDSKEGASLKTREYLSRGKPIILDHIDTDIPDNVDFVMNVKANNSPLNINDILDFYSKIKSTPKDIKDFALKTLDWKIKMRKLVHFMNQVIESGNSESKTYVFLFKNNFEYNFNTLKSIIENNIEGIEIIVVDYQTSGMNRKLLESLESNIKVIETPFDSSDESAYLAASGIAKGEIILINKDVNLVNLIQNSIPTIKSTNKFRSKEEFTEYFDKVKDKRFSLEQNLAVINRTKKQFYINGHCCFCNKTVDFMVDWKLVYNGVPGYRERMICPICGMSARKRLIADLALEISNTIPECKIYIFEQKSKFYNSLKSVFGNNLIGSEYISPEIKSGEIVNGLRHEDAMNLSFMDNSFDLVVSNDVFEHVAEIENALKECYRVLKTGGKLLISIPFSIKQNETVKRAKIVNNEIVHILKPDYHYDPIRKDGSLVFYNYGWDYLTTLKNAGFKDSYIVDSYDMAKGYIGGGMSLTFIAEK